MQKRKYDSLNHAVKCLEVIDDDIYTIIEFLIDYCSVKGLNDFFKIEEEVIKGIIKNNTRISIDRIANLTNPTSIYYKIFDHDTAAILDKITREIYLDLDIKNIFVIKKITDDNGNIKQTVRQTGLTWCKENIFILEKNLDILPKEVIENLRENGVYFKDYNY